MNVFELLQTVYDPDSKVYAILVQHGELVARKALAIADRVAEPAPDRTFLTEAAMLHDIGIGMTASPAIGCTGVHPYICHGYLGRELLERHGLPRHALVCERHVGVGLTAAEIRQRRLPLPDRDMLPVSIEEQIICYADKFYSKNGNGHPVIKSVAEILHSLEPYGTDKVLRFQAWAERFENRDTDAV
jgi:uncharacterized protein